MLSSLGCRGCKERMNEPQGTFSMKFVGRPGGVTMKGAPRSYDHGKVYQMPFRFSRKAYWVLLEKRPELVAPELEEEDNVFDDVVFVPDDSATIELVPVTPLKSELNLDPDAPATLEAHMTYSPSTEKLSKYESKQIKEDKSEEVIEEDEVEEITVKVEPIKKHDRDVLIKILEDAEVEIKKGTRTTTLQKMVDKLVPEG